MANNCLITKLKGVVDNDALLTLNEFVFDINISSDYPYGYFKYQNEASNNYATVIGDGKIGLSADDITHDTITFNSSTLTTIYCSAGNYKIKMPNKQYIRRIDALSDNAGRVALDAVDAKEIKYSNDWLYEAYFKGDVSELSECKYIQVFEALNNNSHGDLSTSQLNHMVLYLMLDNTPIISTTQKIKDIMVVPVEYNQTRVLISNCPNITGDISYLGSIGTANLNINGTNITGTLESYISQLPFDGEYIINCSGMLTYQGNIIPNSADIVITNGVPTVTID